MVGFSEAQKIAAITKTFNDSYKSPMSVIVVDNLERLLGELIATPPHSWDKFTDRPYRLDVFGK